MSDCSAGHLAGCGHERILAPLAPMRPIVINQSSVKTFLDCRRLYGWQRIERLNPTVRKSALEIGTAVHAALAVFHSTDPKKEALPYVAGDELGKALEADVRAIEAGKEATAAEEVTKTAIAAMPEGKEAVAIHTAVTMLTRRAGIQSAFEDKSLSEADEITRRTLEGYFKHWSEKGQLWRPLQQEVQFLVEVRPGWWRTTFGPESVVALNPVWTADVAASLLAEWERLPHSGVFLRGRADNLAVVPGIGLYDVDYKTAAKNDPRDMLKYELDMQLTFYIYAITKQLTTDSVEQGKPPLTLQGAIIDLLVKTKIPQYLREIYTRSNAELEEFEQEIVEYGRELRARHDRVDAGEDWKIVFGKNTQHCFRYGTCPMRDVCLKDTPVRRQLYDPRTPDYVDEAQAHLDARWREGA